MSLSDYVDSIRNSGLTIYDAITPGDPSLWIPSRELEELLNTALKGMPVDYPIRTRSKVVKKAVCRALGYEAPSSFRKAQPRFPGQNFDVYVQKSTNLQIWNEEVSSTRRYVLVDVNAQNVIARIKVVNGDVIETLDKTGTLTSKYQARLMIGNTDRELISNTDTSHISPFVGPSANLLKLSASPASYPVSGKLLSVDEVFRRLINLIGSSFPDPGSDQERNRGAELHKMVCKELGFSSYRDDGTFPDITNQLLEVKLQTSPTIDLGIALPDSLSPIDIPMISSVQIRHCDVRYALFYGQTDGLTVTLTHLFVTTGEDFFSRFTQFGGKVLNKKIQLRLPSDFFD